MRVSGETTPNSKQQTVIPGAMTDLARRKVRGIIKAQPTLSSLKKTKTLTVSIGQVQMEDHNLLPIKSKYTK